MPPEQSSQRKLAAILFADIEGYTAMMQKDEQVASRTLRHFQKQLEDKVALHNGSIVNSYGDGALCSFEIPVDAVRCALELQGVFRQDPMVPVRIGIHSGTVTLEDGKIFGNSVNLASRIESMGCAQSILVSKKVRDEVKNNPDLKMQSLGHFEFKNVDEPMEVFALAKEGLVVPNKEKMDQGSKTKEERSFTSTLLFKSIAGLIIIALGVFLYNKLNTNNTDSVDPSVDLTSSQNSVPKKSIAVLPFADLSPTGDQQYFSLGMMEEILNHLAKIEGLQVTSRTSVMQYAGTVKPITEIAKELNVVNLLEGSVRKNEDQIRITVQLIDGTTDTHLWSETYDKQMVDVFEIQSDVAQSIAGVLQTEINPEVKERIEAIPTTNMEAYELWLQAKNFNFTLGQFGEEEALLLKALEIDPDFAPAYADLGYMWMSQGGFAGNLKREEILSNATYYLEKAMEIDNNYPETHQMLGSFYLWYHWDFERAEREFKTYERLSPAFIYANVFDFYNAAGRFEEAKALAEKMYRVEPNNFNSWTRRGLAYCFNGEFEQGYKYYLKAIELFPDSWYLKSEAARAFAFSGRYDKTIELISFQLQTLSEVRIPRDIGFLAVAHYHNFNRGYTNELLEELKSRSSESPAGSPAYYIAMIYAQMGENDDAFEWLEKAYQDREVEMYWLKVEPTFSPLRKDPRWQGMLGKIGFPE